MLQLSPALTGTNTCSVLCTSLVRWHKERVWQTSATFRFQICIFCSDLVEKYKIKRGKVQISAELFSTEDGGQRSALFWQATVNKGYGRHTSIAGTQLVGWHAYPLSPSKTLNTDGCREFVECTAILAKTNVINKCLLT